MADGNRSASSDLEAPRFVDVVKEDVNRFSIIVNLPSQTEGGPQYVLCVAESEKVPYDASTLFHKDDAVANSTNTFVLTYNSIEPMTLGCYVYCVVNQNLGIYLSSSMDDFVTVSMVPEGPVLMAEDSSDFRMTDCTVVGREEGLRFVRSKAVLSDCVIMLNEGYSDYVTSTGSTVEQSNVLTSDRS